MLSIHHFDISHSKPINLLTRKDISEITHNLLLGVVKNNNIDIDNIEFSENFFGKPFIRNEENFHFNISYSENVIIIATGKNPLGIDIEKKQKLDNDFKEFFHISEQNIILNSNNKYETLRYWTLKESYLKFLGLGLSKKLESFYCLPIKGSSNFYSVTDLEYYNTKKITIKSFDSLSSFTFSICSQSEDFENICIYIFVLKNEM
ncbi:4'-phosphopantetheinyl transferase family protein [Staphylococcus gallinarum]|uniref:4'-phosphopantetheinyl transferase family protein n=1 Tax=Staphylococcus gallinarum TaxID=1293 RepID=UPI0030BF6FEF